MALNASRPTARLASQALRSCRASQSGNVAPLRPLLAATSPFSTSAPRPQENAAVATQDVPRWARTPERMKAPFSPHITKNPANSVWTVNEDPVKLDGALNNLLGRGGDRLLPDEVKWLAVTHKSFDQGRRGFNDRLAFLGKQIAVMEAMQDILYETASVSEGTKEVQKDVFEGRRQPFEHQALEAVDRLSTLHPEDVFDLKKLGRLAVETGISEVVRWKPRKVSCVPAARIRTRDQKPC